MHKQLHEEYELLLLTEQHISILYNWNIEEKHFEYYTCRPLTSHQLFEEYACKTLKAISEKKQRIYVLVKRENRDVPLGKITLFDFNPRNHSAEFGYYLPKDNRAQGLGCIMLNKFIETVFKDYELDLNKIYATTSSNNIPSIKLLEKFGFKMDGRLREHYWINENKYDQLVYSMLKHEKVYNSKITTKSAEGIVRKLVLGNSNSKTLCKFDHEQTVGGVKYFVIHVYDVVMDDATTGHTATLGWYYVNSNNGKVFDGTLGDLKPLN